jgi:hypothetical protein
MHCRIVINVARSAAQPLTALRMRGAVMFCLRATMSQIEPETVLAEKETRSRRTTGLNGRCVH